jgi:hypothetical protein
MPSFFFKDHKTEYLLLEEIFKVSVVYYFVFYLLEQIFPGIISNFLNLNYILALVILTGFILVLGRGEEQEKSFFSEKLTLKDWFFLISLSLLGSLIIFFKIREIGFYAYLISLISFFILILVPYFILQEKD